MSEKACARSWFVYLLTVHKYLHCCETLSFVLQNVEFARSAATRLKTGGTSKLCRSVRNCETTRRVKESAGCRRSSRSRGRSRTCRRSRRRVRRRRDSCRGGKRKRALSRAQKMKQRTCRALRKYRRRAREKFKDTVKEINNEAKITNRIRQIYGIPKK